MDNFVRGYVVFTEGSQQIVVQATYLPWREAIFDQSGNRFGVNVREHFI
jgi:hypothetical protein